MNDERTELQAARQQPTDDRQPWQRPILKRLQVNQNTAGGGATTNDGEASYSTGIS